MSSPPTDSGSAGPLKPVKPSRALAVSSALGLGLARLALEVSIPAAGGAFLVIVALYLLLPGSVAVFNRLA